MTEIEGPQIVGYHPEIRVRDSFGHIAVIKLTLDDWYDEGEILAKLVAPFPGVHTVGDLVTALRTIGTRSRSSLEGSGVVSCCIEPEDANAPSNSSCLHWDDPIC